MAARLKVFVTSDGLTDYVIATSSKAKALAAWGSHQDLFKTGLAHEADDPELVAAATAQPGEVLRRPASGRGELSKPRVVRKPPPKRAPSPAKLKKVADLERRLAQMETAYVEAAGTIERRRRELEEEASRLEGRHRAERARLETQLSAARRALAP